MSRPNPFQQTTQLLKSQQSPSLEQKLGLYQVFQRLYDTNPSLLDELIALENLPAGQAQSAKTPLYIIGNHKTAHEASLTTNLVGDRSQTLYQPEQTWLIGRAPDSGLCLGDARLSRHHAAIQFCPETGFELVDLGSTNGSFVNGEAVRHRQRLKEGDRLRLGSLTILFLEQFDSRKLPPLPDAVLAKLGKASEPVTPEQVPPHEGAAPPESPPSAETMVFSRGNLPTKETTPENMPPSDQGDRQGRLLERLKQMP